ncbi:MAG: hypothetical protein ACFHWX_18795 [Bacteroidota bacterium]
MNTSIRAFVIILLVLLGISAVGGGLVLILDPSGGLMHLPIGFLETTPFDSYLLPGIVLVIVNGIPSLVISITMIRSKRSFPMLIFIQGSILVGWLTIQLMMNKEFFYAPMHYLCYTIGILLLTLGFWLRNSKD